ncbi:MAG: hypothetical protein DMG96_16195 [Acidobacteria bacterium]|nr:MAG: hypothetical protein DMG96_16195 [Acidobacteriota bacterium]
MKPFDQSGAFRPTAAEVSVRRLAVRGAGVTVLSSIVGLPIQMIATVVLARLLTPADFGVVTMVTTFSLLLMNFGGNGFTEAVIQRDTISHALISNLFWVNVGMGVLLTCAFAAAGSLMARFYGDPNVAHVAAGVSLTIFFTSTSILHLALLRRAMSFSTVSAIDVLARIVSVAVSIALGWTGWGYRALVAGAIAQPICQSVGAWLLCRWIPSFPRRVDGTGSMVRFALSVYGRFSVNYFARNMDNLLVGWRFQAQSLGFYKKAYDLFALPASLLVTSLTGVAVSALSRLNGNSAQYRRYFLSALEVLAFVGMGLAAYLTLVGKDLIRLLLGPGWESAGRIFTFFAPGIGAMLLYGTHGWIHLSIGRADRWFRWGIVEFVVTGLLFIGGLAWGPVGIAVAWAASFWILAIPGLWYAGKPIHLGITTVVVAVWKYLVASLLAGCASAIVIRTMPSFLTVSGSGEVALRILTTSLLFAILYSGAVIVLHQGYTPLYQVVGLLQEMVPWSKLSRPSSVVAATCDTRTSKVVT